MNGAFDLGRYANLAKVGACLVCALALLDVALALSLGPEPPWLVERHPLDWNYYQLFGSSVAGAEYQRSRSPDVAPKTYGLLVGASTIERGPVPALVWKRSGIPWLLLGVGAGTGAFSKLRRSLPAIHQAKLTPSAIFLGVHPLWLCSAPELARPPRTLENRIWSVRESKLVSNAIYGRLQEIREHLLGGPDRNTWAVFAPAKAPWTPEPEAPYTEPQSESQRAEHRRKNAEAGRFRPENYKLDSEPVDEMILAVRELLSVQENLTVILMPEHSKYRALVPDIAASVLRSALQGAFREQAPRVVDLRSSLRDEWFFDNYHLTMDGRRAISERLAEVYRALPASSQQSLRH